MVIRGNIRGNGQQLGAYLLRESGNDRIRVLDVAGRVNATDTYLQQTLYGMSLTAELTKSQKGLFHAQINPAYAEDQRMTDADWSKAADILSKELGYDGQRRVIVLHTKKSRTHAHVVFERYDHNTGKVIENKFSRLAQDRARKEMERVFEHAPTPHRNQHRSELKEQLTKLWQETETGADFIQKVHDSGCLLAEGVPRHPFMVVDENGRSFDLVRQLKGIRIKEVRQRLRDVELIPEKEAIEIMQQRKEGSSDASKADGLKIDRDYDVGSPTVSFTFQLTEPSIDQAAEETLDRRLQAMQDFVTVGQELSAEHDGSLERKTGLARDFIGSIGEMTDAEAVADEDRLRTCRGNGAEVVEAAEDDKPVEEQLDTTDKGKPDDERQERFTTEADRFRETLKGFVMAEDELVADQRGQDADRQRQNEIARQFINSHKETTQAADEETEIKRMIEEQKAIRERSRQRAKKRSH